MLVYYGFLHPSSINQNKTKAPNEKASNLNGSSVSILQYKY